MSQKHCLMSQTCQLLDYFKINKPEQTVIVCWQSWDSEHDAQYEMVYSSLFENSDQPSDIDDLFHNQPDMAVIFGK